MDNLSKRETEILNVIMKYSAEHKYPPTVREIGKQVGLSSSATIQYHIKNLVNKGYLKQNNSKNRALEILINNPYITNNSDVVDIPLLGNVTAGLPIEAILQTDEYFSVPSYLIPKNKEVFSLKVHGESMINVGIYDQDIIIVEKKNTANNNDTVVAMTSDNEVTVKTFFKENGYFRLQPENDGMEPIILKEVTILGKVIGLYRKF